MVCAFDHQIQVLPFAIGRRSPPKFEKDVVLTLRLIDRNRMEAVPLSCRLDDGSPGMVECNDHFRQPRRYPVTDATKRPGATGGVVEDRFAGCP
jgi:hypothetical protein